MGLDTLTSTILVCDETSGACTAMINCAKQLKTKSTYRKHREYLLAKLNFIRKLSLLDESNPDIQEYIGLQRWLVDERLCPWRFTAVEVGNHHSNPSLWGWFKDFPLTSKKRFKAQLPENLWRICSDSTNLPVIMKRYNYAFAWLSGGKHCTSKNQSYHLRKDILINPTFMNAELALLPVYAYANASELEIVMAGFKCFSTPQK